MIHITNKTRGFILINTYYILRSDGESQEDFTELQARTIMDRLRRMLENASPPALKDIIQ